MGESPSPVPYVRFERAFPTLSPSDQRHDPVVKGGAKGSRSSAQRGGFWEQVPTVRGCPGKTACYLIEKIGSPSLTRIELFALVLPPL